MTDPAPEQAKIVRIVDIETTGLPEDERRAICEIGWVDLDLATMTVGDPVTFFVNPGHPIPPHIRAVHHISDQDVAAAMRPEQALTQLMKGLGPHDVLCAHKASFEQHFIGGGDRRWLCTWKVSLLAWPDLVSHSNQAIKYSLGIDAEPDFDMAASMPPHRALPDAYTTAFILRRALGLRPLARLVEISGQPGFLPKLTFGKHRGTPFKEAPVDYLQWVVGQKDMDEDVKHTAKYWLNRRTV